MSLAEIFLNDTRIATVKFSSMQVSDNSVLLYNSDGDIIHAIPAGGSYVVLSFPEKKEKKVCDSDMELIAKTILGMM